MLVIFNIIGRHLPCCGPLKMRKEAFLRLILLILSVSRSIRGWMILIKYILLLSS